MKTKLMSVLLAAAMLSALTACGVSSGNPPSTESNPLFLHDELPIYPGRIGRMSFGVKGYTPVRRR